MYAAFNVTEPLLKHLLRPLALRGRSPCLRPGSNTQPTSQDERLSEENTP
ncbi:hypothetical protein Anapl_05283 [Anas platyrhynchos]|uniref:Uncharacterized protein n=1 Tax=Anas platyrhynchos TaxID=8839 RepID=R0JLI8_ANAPL|nr:hypothetical protein Anapl_05283 [Anas platyrhynchos]